ncbi:hypothetical protein QBC46DRAFT_346921 [Diplogelasinospora grovesii]|uniref:Ankyrin repeat protein n=1 Tax=Diplogelasinospora grovesii TaxID=303347 RepID=A0AAN6RZ17_9PEZI|nr:hypothetical protein QBC46DRAFT_346921 [Diplogelasinospora grovesii]
MAVANHLSGPHAFMLCSALYVDGTHGDNGRDVNDGFGPGAGALYAAIIGGQPLEIIAKIVDKGGYIGLRTLHAAMREGRADVLELLLNHRRIGRDVKVEEVVKDAEESADKEIITIVQTWADRKRKLDEKAKRSAGKRRWWKLLF